MQTLTDLAEPLATLWCGFLDASGRDRATPLTDVFHFSDCEADAIELAALVWMYEARGEPVPAAGDLSIVTDWHGAPLCVIETTVVAIEPFDDVTAVFAASEGEGDRSLEHWRRVHWDYFGRECVRLGRAPGHDMPVVCENFRVIHRAEGIS